MKKRLREQYRTLDPVALLAEIRAAQEELGNRIDRRGVERRVDNCRRPHHCPTLATLRRPRQGDRGRRAACHAPPAKRPYKKRVRMPSKLDPHLAPIEGPGSRRSHS